jgi:hypothetical protein
VEGHIPNTNACIGAGGRQAARLAIPSLDPQNCVDPAGPGVLDRNVLEWTRYRPDVRVRVQ